MEKNPNTTLSIMMAAMAITAMLATPALAENTKKPHKTTPHSSAAAAAAEVDRTPETVSSSTTGHRDHKSGPAWKMVGGTVKQIRGDTYMVEDYEGNQVQLFVGQDTKHLRQKKVGDSVRAEITRGGYANSIQ